MASDNIVFSHPVTKVPGCMAVTRNLPGVFPSNVAVLAIAEFRKDFPLLAARLDSIRDACGGGGSDEGAGAAAGVPEFVTPPSNTGVNKALSWAPGFTK